MILKTRRLNNGSNNIKKAQQDKFDEFYTQYFDIENEMNAYLEYNPDVFKGKVVLLPCALIKLKICF